MPTFPGRSHVSVSVVTNDCFQTIKRPKVDPPRPPGCSPALAETKRRGHKDSYQTASSLSQRAMFILSFAPPSLVFSNLSHSLQKKTPTSNTYPATSLKVARVPSYPFS